MDIMFINLPKRFDACHMFNAVTFYAEKLLSARILKNIEVRIVFKSGLIRKERVEADCVWDDNNVRPKDFIIRVDAGMGLRKTLISLAHEMVHLKQYARGEMRDLIRSSSKLGWYRETIDTMDLSYWDLPWEIEAHGRERGLYEQFKAHWRGIENEAQTAYKAEPDSAGTPHTFVLETYRGKQGEI